MLRELNETEMEMVSGGGCTDVTDDDGNVIGELCLRDTAEFTENSGTGSSGGSGGNGGGGNHFDFSFRFGSGDVDISGFHGSYKSIGGYFDSFHLHINLPDLLRLWGSFMPGPSNAPGQHGPLGDVQGDYGALTPNN